MSHEVQFLGIFFAFFLLAALPRRKSRSAWWKQYRAYLKSPEWKAYRARKLASVGYRCENKKCGVYGPNGQGLHCHHKRSAYKRLGKERLCDTKVLCRKCHNKVHKRKF